MIEVTHNNLPEAVAQMLEEQSEIKRLLLELGKGNTIATDKPLNLIEAAEFLNLAPDTVYTKVSHKELPHRKRGGRLYFDRDELQAYINGGKRMSVAEIKESAKASNRKTIKKRK
jgi:excisionase family DNA binding protein